MYFGALRTQAQRGKVPQMIEFDKNNSKLKKLVQKILYEKK